MWSMLISVFVLAFSMLWMAAANAADLVVEVRGVETTAGSVRVALFDRAADFPDRPAKGLVSAPMPPAVTATFKGLAEGDYAVAAYHDRNGNGVLDKNFLGVPTEPYAFSGDARSRFGPPSFADAVIHLGSESRTITLTLH